MPLYEYECRNCGKRFEKFCSIKNRHSATCPDCGTHAQMVVSQFSFEIAAPLTVYSHDGKVLAKHPRITDKPDSGPPTYNLPDI